MAINSKKETWCQFHCYNLILKTFIIRLTVFLNEIMHTLCITEDSFVIITMLVHKQNFFEKYLE